MFTNTNILPSDPSAQVEFIGEMEKVQPAFDAFTWEYIANVKAERVVSMGEWSYTAEVPREIDPCQNAFWLWGDVLIRVIPATILESGLYFFRRREARNGT